MNRRPFSWSRLTVVTAAALVINLAIYALGKAADATWDAGAPYEIGAVAVVGATLVPLLLGGLVVSLLARRWPKSQRLLAWAGLVFALVSMPMGYIASQDGPTGLALGAMHVVAGFAWFFGVRPTATHSAAKEPKHV